MKLTALVQHIGNLTKSQRDIQADIDVSEVYHLWHMLVSRYDVLETTNILANFAQDTDLKLILNMGLDSLIKQIEEVEQQMNKYAIPLPKRPPESANNTANVEIITDEYIFRRIFNGIQAFIPIHASAFIKSTSPAVREVFKKFLFQEVEIYDKFFEYGKLKGYISDVPNYRQ